MHKFLAYIICYQLSLCVGMAKQVLVVPIESEIDVRMSRFVDLALSEAVSKKYDYVIFSINTYGGAVQDADKIRTAILNLTIPNAAFINKNAASAGALISIACQKIYMQSGSSIGAATVVNGQDGQPMPDKYQSYMRSMMRATAETRGRNPEIAEAMVDPDIVLDTAIKPEGKVLTFTTAEAVKYKYCDGIITDLDSLLRCVGLENAEVTAYEISDSEKIIAFFMNPAISGILILIMLGGIYFELQTPGVGFPLIAAIVAALLYFTPYYLNGLAENWEILVFVIGIILLGLELFIIPGFGLPGVVGIVMMLAGLILAMLNNVVFDFNYVNTNALEWALISVFSAFFASLILLFTMGRKFIESTFFKKISLKNTEIRPFKDNENMHESLKGKAGVTTTTLRPAGKIQIDGQTYDAISDSEYIEPGIPVQIIDVFNGTLRVKKFQ